MKKELYEKIKKVYYDDYKKSNKLEIVMSVMIGILLLIATTINSNAQVFLGTGAVIMIIASFRIDDNNKQKEQERKADMDELLKEVE